MTDVRPKVVMLDDLRVFHPHIISTIDGAVVYLRTSESAIAWLDEAVREGWHVSQFWFDHDLGIVDGKLDDTMPVARAILNDGAFQALIDQVVIHTSNPVGGDSLQRLLTPIWGTDCLRVSARYYAYAED